MPGLGRRLRDGLQRRFGTPEVAVDAGTASIRVCGQEAAATLRAPSFARGAACEAVPALRAGVVCDAAAAVAVLRPLLERAGRSRRRRPRALACVPSDADAAERGRIEAALREAGAASVRLVPEPLAAATGAGIDVLSPWCQVVVDVGEGVTDVALVREGRLAATAAVRVACADLRAALVAHVARRHGMRLARVEAERLLRAVGLAPRRGEREHVEFVGAPVVAGAPRFARASRDELRDALEPALEAIVARVARFVTELPDREACEAIESGIHLTGGGALLHGLSERLVTETRLAVRVVDRPLDSVIEGARRMLARA